MGSIIPPNLSHANNGSYSSVPLLSLALYEKTNNVVCTREVSEDQNLLQLIKTLAMTGTRTTDKNILAMTGNLTHEQPQYVVIKYTNLKDYLMHNQ